MTKTKLALLILIPFIMGFIVCYLVLMSNATNDWYLSVNAVPHQRIMLVDKTQEDSVTLIDIYGNKSMVTKEP